MERYCYKCEKDVELVMDLQSNAQLCSVCGTVIIHSASHLSAGTILGGFEIIEELGRGGMGIVYKAKQLNLARDVALKVLADDLAKDHEFVDRFFKEARAAASLNHPNIVQVFDAGSTPDGISFFAMELIEGITLENRIEEKGKLPPQEALKIAVLIADALDYAWKSQSLTHGDIKPDNIILNNTGSVKLADLGLAKVVNEDPSDDGIMATPLYAPPEVIRGDLAAIGFRSDMYSFGATFYQMLTGVTLFPDNSPEIVFQQHLNDTPSPLHNYNDHFAPALVKIVEQLLEKDPEKRPDSWETVCKALKKIKHPELEGRVFHANAHEEHEEQTEAVESSGSGSSFLMMMIKTLVGITVVLIVAIAAIIAMKFNGNFIRNQPKNNPQLITLQWNGIKKDLPDLDTLSAFEKIKTFVDENNRNVPIEAIEKLKELQKLVDAEKKKEAAIEAEKKEFLGDVATLIEKLKSAKFKNDDNDIPQIIKLNRKIEKILKTESLSHNLTINSDDKSFLQTTHTQFSDRIRKYNDEMTRLRMEKLALEQQKRLDAETAKITKTEEERKASLKKYATVDNYYAAIHEFRNQRKLSVLKNALNEWDNESNTVDMLYAMRVDFMTNTVIPKVSHIYKMLQAQQTAFTGQPLPDEMCSAKLRHYKIKEFSDRGIKLVYTTPKVTLGENISWTSVSPKHLLLMIRERILNNGGASSLDDDTKSTILAFSLLFDRDDLDIIIENMDLPHNNKKLWLLIKKDFTVAENEYKNIELYHRLCTALENKNFEDAVELYTELSRSSRKTAFADRYSDELKRINRQILHYSPDVAAEEWIDKCLSIPKAETVKIFNLCMTINARYHASMDCINAQKVKELSTRKKHAVTTLMANSGVSNITDNRIPFCYWTREKQCASEKYSKLIVKSRKLDSMPKLLQTLQLAVAVDNGDWHTVKTLYTSIRFESLQKILCSPRTKKAWTSSLLFGYGLADMQFGNGDHRLLLNTAMKNFMQTSEHYPRFPIVTNLAFEYSLLTRQRVLPLTSAARFNYKQNKSGFLSARIGMLGILANIEKQNPDLQQVQFLRSRLSNVFGKEQKLQGDFYYIDMAEQLLSQKQCTSQQITKLISTECYFPDITSRILLASLSRFYILGGEEPEADEGKLFNALEKHVTPLTVSGDLWRRIILVKMAKSPYAGDINRIADSCLQKTDICTLRFYPGLLMLKAGTDFVLGRYSREETQQFLTRYMKVSDLASAEDIASLQIITSSQPELIVEKLFKEHQPEKAFSYGILGIMMHCKDPLTKSKIMKVFNDNYASMCVEERFLLLQIQNWR